MKTSLKSITLGALCVFAVSAQATSPVYPIQPVQPIIPIRPILPIRPIRPIQPILPILPIQPDISVDVGAVPFYGYGYRTESVEFDSRLVNHVRLRIPNHCAIQINPVVFRGEMGRARGHLVTTYNDGAYSHFLYGVNGGMGAELGEVELGLSSVFTYSPQHQCGVRVFVSGSHVSPYNR